MFHVIRTGSGHVPRVLCRQCPVSPLYHVSRSGLSTSTPTQERRTQPTGKAGMPSPWLRTPFFHERGPPPGVDLSLQERLDELYPKDPVKGDRVNIGFALESSKSSSRDERGRIAEWRRKARSNKELEKAAREGTLVIDLNQVKSLLEVRFFILMKLCFRFGPIGLNQEQYLKTS